MRDRTYKIGSIGDVNPIDHGGGYVFYVPSRPYYHLEYTHGDEDDGDEGPKQLALYRVDLEVDAAGFARDYSWVKWGDVARSSGVPLADLTDPAVLAHPFSRAMVIWDAASYYGWEDFDSYPLRMRRGDLAKRWSTKMYKLEDLLNPPPRRSQGTLF